MEGDDMHKMAMRARGPYLEMPLDASESSRLKTDYHQG